jgi:hypothetical protein
MKYFLLQGSGYLSRYSDGLRAGRYGFGSQQSKVSFKPALRSEAGASSRLLTFHLVAKFKKVEQYLHFPICLYEGKVVPVLN